MKRSFIHIVAIAAIGMALVALAAWPFLARPSLPRDTDAELHVFRAAQIGEALRGGAGYVRWAPDLWHGYGYPIFNYYAPLTYYLANLFALAGLDMVNAIKAVFILGLALATCGMYVFVRGTWGRRAGLLAAAVYVFAPYLIFVDPHLRGDLPEFFAVCLIPWLFWAFQLSVWDTPDSTHRRVPAGCRSLIGILLWAALPLTHNLMGIILSVLLVAWLAWQLLFLSRVDAARVYPVLVAAGLALGLAAFFWLPFILERGAVRLQVVGSGQFDFHNHFVAWRDLIAASAPLDLAATAPRFPHNLGLVQWLFALPAVPLAFLSLRRDPRARQLAFFVLAAALLIFLMLSPSAFIWERVPLMAFIQFPWRLLGPAAALLAVCAGASIAALESRWPGRWVPEAALAAALLVVLVLALPALYPPPWTGDFGPTTPLGILAVEEQGRWLGTTSTSDFMPVTVKSDPPTNPDLIASYNRGAVDKFDHSSLPAGAAATVLEHGPTRDRFTVTSPQPFTARVLTFVFPGWQVLVDGRPVPVTPSDPYGLITFPLPAGEHEVRVEFGSTLPRTAGTLISLAALVAWAVLAWFALKRRLRISASVQTDADRAPGALPKFWLPLAVVLAFAVVKIGYLDGCPTCFRYTSPPGQVLGAQWKLDPQATPSVLAGEIRLLAFDLPRTQVQAGGVLPLTLYWQAIMPVSKNYQGFVHLSQADGKPWGMPLHDKLNPGEFPTTRWPLNMYVWDDYVTPETAIRVQPDAPPGEYQIRVGLYTLADLARAPVLDAAGRPAGDSIVLPIQVRVTSAR